MLLHAKGHGGRKEPDKLQKSALPNIKTLSSVPSPACRSPILRQYEISLYNNVSRPWAEVKDVRSHIFVFPLPVSIATRIFDFRLSSTISV
jgi:hypothetical protein